MRILAIFISVLALAVAVGCGDDSSSASLTKAEFNKQANAACKKNNLATSGELLAYINKNGNKPLTEDQKVELTEDVIVPSLQRQIDALGELESGPEAQQEVLDELIEAMEETVEKGEEDPSGLASEFSPFAKSEKIAQENELKFCGRSQ